MDYWPSLPWKALVSSSKDPVSTIELELPFALIGSHPACNVQISRRAPRLAYIAFSFADSIEVWPLCALAFSQWGLLSPDQKLRVGRTTIEFVQDCDNEEIKAGDAGAQQDPPSTSETPTFLQIDFRGNKGSFALDRRVVILGDDHPSTRRLHGVGFARCEQAIVSVGQSCWLINLRPGKEDSVQDLVTLLPPEGNEIQIGKIAISTRQPDDRERAKYLDSGPKDLPLSSDTRLLNRNRWLVEDSEQEDSEQEDSEQEDSKQEDSKQEGFQARTSRTGPGP